mmetsp:Transcript_6599/g.23290  ORF Transcript_6599/g.23290 Transcript_6599/m.23290 type:complete len:188 (-) Transcript_6599:62-625(-)
MVGMRTEQRLEVGPPIDWSFKELSSLEETLSTEPNSGVPKGSASGSLPSGTMANSNSLRVSNNDIGTLEKLVEVAEATLDDPSQLAWLDASHCGLTSVEPVLLRFPQLKVLYLHGNNITKLSEVTKLGQLANLQKLTLHGNPMEELPNYRLHVLTTIPKLRSLDFSAVTKLDRDKAETWNKARRSHH